MMANPQCAFLDLEKLHAALSLLLQSLKAAMSSETAPTNPNCLPPQSDLNHRGGVSGGGGGPGEEEQPRQQQQHQQQQQLPKSITSSDHDRTQSFQLAHNIHILPHLPKYSIIIQKKSNELLGKLLEKKVRGGEKLSKADADSCTVV